MSRAIVIDRGIQQVRLLECDLRGTRVVIRKASILEIPETPELGESDAVQSLVLRELSGFAGSGAPVLGLIGRSNVVLRDLRLPDVPANEMPGMVQLQAMRELSFPIEQAAIDYEVVGPPEEDGQRRVMLAALQKDVIERLQSAIRSCQLELSRVGLRPYATWRAYRAVSVVPAAAVLVVTLAGESLELTVGQGDSVLFSRATLLRATSENKGEKYDPAPSLVSEVRRTLAAFASQVRGVAVERVALAAGPGEHQTITTALADAGLSIAVDRFDPFAAVELSGEAKQALSGAAGERGAYVAAIGAAVSASETWPIDFLNPKKPVIVRDRRKPIAIIAAAAAALLVTGSYGIVQLQLARGRQKNEQQAQRNSELQERLKGANDIIRKYQAVDQWRQSGVDALAVLDRLTSEHPSTKDMYVTSLRIDRDRTPNGGGNSKVVLDGLARQQVTVSEFNTKLNDGEYFNSRPVTAQRQKSGGDFSYSFKSDIVVKKLDAAESSSESTEESATSSEDPPPSIRPASKRSESPAKGSGRRSR